MHARTSVCVCVHARTSVCVCVCKSGEGRRDTKHNFVIAEIVTGLGCRQSRPNHSRANAVAGEWHNSLWWRSEEAHV